MEVLGFISLDSRTKVYIKSILDNCEELVLGAEDDETFYYYDYKTNASAIFLDKNHTDIQEEFRINMTIQERKYILNYFKSDTIYYFDMLYKDHNYINVLLRTIKLELPKVDKRIDVLIFHPFEGIKHLESFI